MNEIKETGGARIGMANASWPFATLTVTKDKLELNATILGKLVFKPSDIISIEPDSSFFRSGLKINHNVPTYKKNVVFVSGNADTLIERIDEIGFLTNLNPISRELSNAIEASQATGGFPIKTSAAIVIVLVWNIFFLFDIQKFLNASNEGSPLGIGAQLGLGFILLTCILLLISEPIRRFILKDGRNINDIKPFVFFIMVICVFMLIVLTLVGSLNQKV